MRTCRTPCSNDPGISGGENAALLSSRRRKTGQPLASAEAEGRNVVVVEARRRFGSSGLERSADDPLGDS